MSTQKSQTSIKAAHSLGNTFHWTVLCFLYSWGVFLFFLNIAKFVMQSENVCLMLFALLKLILKYFT